MLSDCWSAGKQTQDSSTIDWNLSPLIMCDYINKPNNRLIKISMIDNRFKRLVMKGKIVEDKSYMVVFFHM